MPGHSVRVVGDWLVEQGFQALLGGLVAGLFAWLAVWLTLRGMRQQAEVADCEMAVAKVLSSSTQALLTMRVALESKRWDPVYGRVNDRMASELAQAAAAMLEAQARVHSRWPGLARELEGAVERAQVFTDVTTDDEATVMVRRLVEDGARIAMQWTRDHEAFE